MSPLRAATTGATTASASFSSAIGTPNLAIHVRAPANTINRCNSAGGKTRHAARRPHGPSASNSENSVRAYVFRFASNSDIARYLRQRKQVWVQEKPV